MKIVFSGSTSDTGYRVLKRLVTKFGEDSLTCLVRPTSDTSLLKHLGVKTATGDVIETDTLKKVLNSSVIYLDMTHPKYYNKSLAAVIKSGVERAYFVTTTGIFSQYNEFSQIYKENEAKIRDSGIVYTILRPSMIYGSIRDKNMHRLIKFLNQYPIFPLFGGGQSLMQPVYVDDLADAIACAVGNKKTEYQEYNLAGPKGIKFCEIIEIILNQLERRVIKIPMNISLAAKIVKYAQYIPDFPITEEQVLRLREDKVFEINNAINDLEFCPRSFEKGIIKEIEEMRVNQIL